MRGDAHQRKPEYDEEAEPRTFFVCIRCGTMASTNSGKRYAGDQSIDFDAYDGYEKVELKDGQGGPNSVRMTPACPCGCDIFNHVTISEHDQTYE